MKDVAALCRRVVIIAGGKIVYDGSLDGIIDRFGGQKVVTLSFAATDDDNNDVPSDLAQYGEVLQIESPKARLRVDRQAVPNMLGAILAKHAVEDVSVEDPPLEETIAAAFSQMGNGKEEEETQS